MNILLTRLLSLGAAASDAITDINHGGCCVYASLLGKELQKREIPCSVVVVSDSANIGSTNIDKVRWRMPSSVPNLQAWEECGVYFTHVALEVDIDGVNYFVDSDGIAKSGKKLRDFRPYPGRLSLEEAEFLARKESGWNERFDRNEIPRLRGIIKLHMRAYDSANKKIAATALSKA